MEQETQISQLQRERKYLLEVGSSKFIPVLYRGPGDIPQFAKDWPHEFITPYPPGISANETDHVLSFRIREGGFRMQNNIIIPIPEENGRFFYSNTYSPILDNTPFGGITTEQREGMLEEMREAGM